MASIGDFVKAKLDRFKRNVLGPSTPPPQVQFSRDQLSSPRVQAAYRDSLPLIQQANQANTARFEVDMPKVNFQPSQFDQPVPLGQRNFLGTGVGLRDINRELGNTIRGFGADIAQGTARNVASPVLDMFN